MDVRPVESHRWINFQFSVADLPAKAWLLLGEARSKCDHIAGVPLRPTVADMLHRLFVVKGVLATTAIEGNTLTEEEVKDHLAGKLTLPPSRQYLTKEIDNIVAACNGIMQEVSKGNGLKLSVPMIEGFNAQVLDGLVLEEGVVPGRIRTHDVGVGSVYRGAPHQEAGRLLQAMCDWLNGPSFRAAPGENKEMGVISALLRAILAHLYMAWIHPFGDGNGRTARLVEYQVLIAAGLPTPAAHLLSNHYNQTRNEYYRQLRVASESGGNVMPFIEYALGGFVEGLRLHLSLIREQQLDVVWRNFVYEQFRDRKSSSDQRQRQLVLELSRQGVPVPKANLRDISPIVARDYARKTDKTLARDLNVLMEMGLIRREAAGFVAASEQILAFLPLLPRTEADVQLDFVADEVEPVLEEELAAGAAKRLFE
jgi:Fic family protein